MAQMLSVFQRYILELSQFGSVERENSKEQAN